MLWENIISNDFPAAVEQAKGVCVVPIGCLEKHGPHSPLGTDIIAPREMAVSAAKKEPVVIFPTMYFGEKTGAGEFPGTVIFSHETRWHMFRDTCNEIYRNGFKKILLLNGHGGNAAMLNLFARAMLKENPNIMVFSCESTGNASFYSVCREIAENPALDYLTEEDRTALRDFADNKKVFGHGGMMETAWLYHYAPDTMRLDRIADEDGLSTHKFDEFSKNKIVTHFTWMANYPNSYTASSDYVMNARIAKAITEYYENLLTEKFTFLKNETISNEYHAEWLAKQS